MSETYISVDIETNGPIPGDFSMLSIGAVAFSPEYGELGAYYANLQELPGASESPATMEWWKGQPEAWKQLQTNRQDPRRVMFQFSQWAKGYDSPVFVAYPAGFDWTFVYWYLMHFTEESPFSFSALDIKTFAMARLNAEYRKSTKRQWPKRWKAPYGSHTHNALDDAREQGVSFLKMLNDK